MTRPRLQTLALTLALVAQTAAFLAAGPAEAGWTPPTLVALSTGPGDGSMGAEGVTLYGGGSNNVSRIEAPAGSPVVVGGGHPSGIQNFVAALDEGRARLYYRTGGNLTAVDVFTGDFLGKFPLPHNLVHLEYDPAHDRLVGLVSGETESSFGDRGFLVKGDGSNELVEIDPWTGTVNEIGGGLPSGIVNFAGAIDESGSRFFYANETSLVTVDAVSGALVSAVPFSETVVSLDFDQLNLRLLALRWWPGMGGSMGPEGMTLGGGPIDLAVLDPATGGMSFLAVNLPNEIHNFAAAYDHQEARYYYQRAGGELVTVDAGGSGTWQAHPLPFNVVSFQNHRAFGPPPGCQTTGPWNCAIEVSLKSQWIQLHQFTPNAPVTIEVQGADGTPLFKQSYTTGEIGHVMVQPDLGGATIRPGDRVIATDDASGVVKTLVLAPIFIHGKDADADKVWGSAPPGERVLVGPPDPRVETYANEKGEWFADFQSVGFDVGDEMAFIANVFDDDGDSTADELYPPPCADGFCPDFAVEHVEVEPAPRARTDWGDVHDGMRRSVLVKLTNRGNEDGVAQLKVSARTVSDGAERAIPAPDVFVGAGQTHEVRVLWEAIGQVGDVVVETLAWFEGDPTPWDNHREARHYSLAGETGRGYTLGAPRCEEAPPVRVCTGTGFDGDLAGAFLDAQAEGRAVGAGAGYSPFSGGGFAKACRAGEEPWGEGCVQVCYHDVPSHADVACDGEF